MFRKSVHSSSQIFFPWERKKGLLGILRRLKAHLLLLLIGGGLLVTFVYQREKHHGAVRATHAMLDTTYHAVYAYRAGHEGQCPRSLTELVTSGLMRKIPVDGWNQPLHFVCPGELDPMGFDLFSDGLHHSVYQDQPDLKQEQKGGK